jgi:Leucine-rich repeat (LRR) protein
LKKLKYLKKLSLGSFSSSEKKINITDEGIQNLNFLEELNIGTNNIITDEGLKNLKNLKILYCNDNITIDCIKNLKNLTRISSNKLRLHTDVPIQ